MVNTSTNKNGYEIRADILRQAQDHCYSEYANAYQVYEQSVCNPDYKGEKVSKPSSPNTQTIVSTAEQMYEFVNTQS